MSKCRNCGGEIGNDERICPHCGIAYPAGLSKEISNDFTSRLDPVMPEYELYRMRTRKTTCLLFCLAGWTGAGFFYLGNKIKGVLWLLGSLLFIVGLSTLGIVYQTQDHPAWLYILVVMGIVYCVNIGFGLYFLFASGVKDAEEELLR
ncbi:MAG: TM2 domain-containing protein [Bacilli bacterium]|jgi:hypothetical protein|nr:TM2 domain-containing protein [Bacilli bacterium]